MFADDMLLPTGTVRTDPARGGVTLSIGLRLNWYRALPVSCVEHLQVTVDGVPLWPQAVVVRLGRVESGPDQLVAHDDEWWPAGQVAQVDCALATEPDSEQKDAYEVRVELGTRVPYMPPPADGPWRLVRDSCVRTVTT